MTFEFSISGWSGCAAGLHSQDEWLVWAGKPWLPIGEEKVTLAEMPPLLRRRLSDMGRTAVQAAYRCQPDVNATDTPVVFGSRYGDAARSLALITEFGLHAAVSPADFALSVHNAIGAVYSIARRDTSNYLAVAGGEATSTAAIVEAIGLLASGVPEVLVVCYEGVLPGPYAMFQSEPAAPYAWAWRVEGPKAGRARFQLSTARNAGPAQRPTALPFGLDVMRFAISGDALWQRDVDGVLWTLSRHA